MGIECFVVTNCCLRLFAQFIANDTLFVIRYLATHLPEVVMSHEEIAEAYRQRWAIEVLWKFLKMHLKLDKMMSKNLHGITIQIYVILIVYLISQLLKAPQIYGIYGSKLVDKLRYIQITQQEWHFVHWLHRVVPCLNM